MKGLMIKDIYCLRRSLKQILLLIAAVVTLGLLFTLSSKYGNVALAMKDMAADGELTEKEFMDMFRMGIWCLLLVPVALLGNILDCYKADADAHFTNMQFALPVSKAHIVLSRYAVCLLYAEIGLAGSLLAAAAVSAASDALPFAELSSIILFFLGIILLFISIVMPLYYLFSAKYADVIQIGTLIFLLAVFFLCCRTYLTDFIRNIVEVQTASPLDLVPAMRTVLTNYGWLSLLAGLLAFAVSCGCSIKILSHHKFTKHGGSSTDSDRKEAEE